MKSYLSLCLLTPSSPSMPPHKVLSKSIIKSFFLVEKEFLSKWSNHKEKLFITLGEMTAPIEKSISKKNNYYQVFF